MGLFGSPDLSNKKEKPKKPKKPFYKRWWFIVIVLIFIIGAIGGEDDIAPIEEGQQESIEVEYEVKTNSENEEVVKLNKEEDQALKEQQTQKEKEEFIDSAKGYDYKEIERNPDEYKGKPGVFKGKVIQVSESILNTVIYRVSTKGDFEDIIYVSYKRAEGESRVLEDDTVTIYGELDGVTTYTSILSGKITVPSIKAKYIVIE